MKMKTLIAITVLILSSQIAACGDEDKKDAADDHPTENNNGTTLAGETAFNITDAEYATDNGAYQAKKYRTCTKDLTSGLLTVDLGNGDARLTLQVKNVSSAAKTYACKQAANNSTDDTDLGDKFNGCMVDVRATSDADHGASGYSMYRETDRLAPFKYEGDCSVKIEQIDDSVSGSFTCENMLQTFLEGSYRNPVDTAITATVSGDFSCVLVKQ